LRSLVLLRVGLALLVIIDLVQRSFDLKAHYTDLGILPRWALTHDLGNVWSVSLHNLNGTSELEAAGFVFTRNRTRGTASAWLLTDLLTNKKTRPIASRLWRFQPPRRNNLRTNLTTQTRGFCTALRRQRSWVRISPQAYHFEARISPLERSRGLMLCPLIKLAESETGFFQGQENDAAEVDSAASSRGESACPAQWADVAGWCALRKSRTWFIVLAFTSSCSFHGYTVDSAFGANSITSMAASYECDGVLSGMTSIGV